MHTPGPWKIGRKGDYDCDIAGPNGEDLGFVNCSDGLDEPTHYPMEANARLIAAAPELLAALIQATSRADKDLKEHFRGRTDQCSLDYAMCMAAIAKATEPRP